MRRQRNEKTEVDRWKQESGEWIKWAGGKVGRGYGMRQTPCLHVI